MKFYYVYKKPAPGSNDIEYYEKGKTIMQGYEWSANAKLFPRHLDGWKSIDSATQWLEDQVKMFDVDFDDYDIVEIEK